MTLQQRWRNLGQRLSTAKLIQELVRITNFLQAAPKRDNIAVFQRLKPIKN